MPAMPRPLFLVIAASLLALVAGGVFISVQWQSFPVYPEEPPKIVSQIASSSEPIFVPEAKPLQEQVLEAIGKSEALIAQAQEFIAKEKNKAVLLKEAKEKSADIRGVYMNEFAANSQNAAMVNTRGTIKKLLDETELNGVVIDIKEAGGPNLPYSLKKFIDELHQKGVWVIARVVVFRDASQKEKNPSWYVKKLVSATSTDGFATTTETFWQDSAGGYWLDPKNKDAQDYIIGFSKKAIDFGFDEIQFDYIRFPSDGDTINIIYPYYDAAAEKKYEVIRDFFSYASSQLRDYKGSIMLSADLFGYVATQYQSFEIGQRISDAAKSFDYISFMLYPSHFYGGFKIDADLKRGLPQAYFPYKDSDISQVVSSNPYQVVLRSILEAWDYLESIGSGAKIRPWLQDFDLAGDASRGIYYDAEKVKAQIQAAKDASSSGWLLWNKSSVYTKEAFDLVE